MGTVIDLARRSPAAGLAIGGVLLAIGAGMVWGDPKRGNGLLPIFGMLVLIFGVMACLASVVTIILNAVTSKTNRSPDGSPSPAVRSTAHAANAAASPLPAAAPPRDGRAFERSVAAFFRAQGYAVTETGTHGTGGDRGVDLILRRPDAADAETICVQCKDFADWRVGAPDVRAFHGAVSLRGPGHVGWIVTTSRFTADAKRDAAQLGIRLIDGDAWASMCRATDFTPPPPPIAAAVTTPPAAASVTAPATAAVPLCPACRTAMVRRDPRPGGKAFAPFWGCANYPRCRKTVDIA